MNLFIGILLALAGALAIFADLIGSYGWLSIGALALVILAAVLVWFQDRESCRKGGGTFFPQSWFAPGN